MKRALLLAGLVLAGGCRPAAVEQMAQTTVLIDQQAARVYETHADVCRDTSDAWVEYDVCMAPWEGLLVSVLDLYAATRALDVAPRKFKPSACAWYAAVVDVHTIVPLPVTTVVVASKLSKKCR